MKYLYIVAVILYAGFILQGCNWEPKEPHRFIHHKAVIFRLKELEKKIVNLEQGVKILILDRRGSK